MDNTQFEKCWMKKFSRQLNKVAGDVVQKEVMKGGEAVRDNYSQEKVLDWTQKAMERLDSLVDEEKKREIMAGCACRYSESQLDEIRKTYEETEDIDVVHQMLQTQFKSFLRTVMDLDEDRINEIVRRGWGSAGVKEGDTITATKIPKSGYLIEYLEESDPERRRALYCHCPRVRDAVRTGTSISPTYCYCGAGFYKGIWEYILQQPVTVEVLESVLQGDDHCTIRVHLPKRSRQGGG